LSIKKILILRRNGFGDLVVTLPMIQSLKNKYPKAKITLVGSFRGKKLIPYIDTIDNFFIIPKGNKYIQTLKVCLSLRKQKFDLAFSAKAAPQKLMNLALWLTGAKKRIAYTDNHWSSILINNPRLYKRNKNQHNALSILKITNPKFKEIPNNIYPRINAKQNSITNFKNKVDLILDSNCFNLFISISNNRKTSILTNDNLCLILNKLYKQHNNLHIIIFYIHEDIHQAQELKKSLNPTSEIVTNQGMGHFLCLLDMVDALFIGDGGLMHLAAALNKDQLVLFAKTPVEEWGPISNKAKLLIDNNDINNIPKDIINKELNLIIQKTAST
jgi:ADP-heptose:LPS heptosyltransferase